MTFTCHWQVDLSRADLHGRLIMPTLACQVDVFTGHVNRVTWQVQVYLLHGRYYDALQQDDAAAGVLYLIDDCYPSSLAICRTSSNECMSTSSSR